MELTKRELLQGGGISHQEALVNRLLDQVAVKPIKKLIPAGKKMLEQIDQSRMEKAVYNWLRGCAAFTEVTISFAKDPDKYQLKKRRVRDLPKAPAGHMPWELLGHGRDTLAKYIADVINSERLVKITTDAEGIWAFTDANDIFGPYREATQADVDAQETLATEVRAEMKQKGEDPDTLVYDKTNLGDLIPSEDWEPYIEFLPQRKSKYGRM